MAVTDPHTVQATDTVDGHLAKLHEAERRIAEVEQTRDQLRSLGREALGVGGQVEAPPLRVTVREHGLTLYPLVALGFLAIADTFHTYAFAVLAPDVARSLGLSIAAVAGIRALETLMVALAPLPIAAAAQRYPRRALLVLVTSFVWVITAALTAFVTSTFGLLVVLVVNGVTTAAAVTLHQPLVMDSYPPAGRVRAMSTYTGFDRLGNFAGPLLVALLTGILGYTWRGAFLILGIVAFGAVLGALRLRDPGFGRFDTEKIRQAVHRSHGESQELAEEDVSLGFFEIVRRLFLIPTVRRTLFACAVFGILLIPFQTFLFFFLEEIWGLGPGSRGLFFAYTAAMSIGALALYGGRAEKEFRRDPARLMRVASSLLGVGVVLFAMGGLSPFFWVMVVLFGLGFAAVSLINVALIITILSVIPSRMRPHASALIGIFLGGVGGVIGAVLLGGVERRFGVAGSMVALLVPGVIGALVLRTTGKFVDADLDRMIDEIIEEEEIKRLKSQGAHLPMLACRGVDFSYGQLQVLFDVDFSVDDGEMVALLGVNGAGKSTLLRVISGLGLPTKGSVRYRGQDVTYLDAERRLRLGITQVPGGRAVFGPLTVTENLRLFGYHLGRDRSAVDAAIERSFAAFPRLHERRNQNASTLSGGEQQMLGLSKALILRPRLLLIDELSLGLAPIIVGQLLDLVRQINADGTAVVLVEQSVNIALSLVDHAYFMEKGQIRFDGVASDLLGREDLLRAVFLEGVGKSEDAVAAGA